MWKEDVKFIMKKVEIGINLLHTREVITEAIPI